MIQRNKIKTKDGKTIIAICYLPDTSNGKAIIVAPAAQIIQQDYEAFSIFFQQLGYTVITFDYRGVGESAPAQLTGFEARLQHWAVHDADAVIRFVKSSFQNQELIYIGHGIGGELIGLAQASQYINRLVLVSSSLSCKRLWNRKGRWRLFARKLKMRMISKFLDYMPGGWLAYYPELPKGVAHEWANWCDRPNGLFDFFPENNYRKLQVPLLAISFLNDWMTPEKAVKELLAYFSGSSISWHQIHPDDPGLRKNKQYSFFDLDMKSQIWPFLQKWLNEDCL